MTEEPEFIEVGDRVGAMWLALAEKIAQAIPHVLEGGEDPTVAIRWATCAEACFWKSTGDSNTHDVKDVLAEQKDRTNG